MEEFLGILFAGGRGSRLGLITQYISKAFVPIHDRPVFMYPLAQLEASRYIRKVVILTNEQNDEKLRQTGYQTVIQDDARVHDMLTGLAYLREVLQINQHCVLMPCDNVSDLVVDQVIEAFMAEQSDVCFSLTSIPDRAKLSQMGVYDPSSEKLIYKPQAPPSNWGMIAPYVINRDFQWRASANDAEVFNQARACHTFYRGEWHDIGDPISIAQCTSSRTQIPQVLSN